MTPDELIEKFRQKAVAYGEATERGSFRRANRMYDVLMRIRRELRNAGPEHVRKLLRLLDDDNLYVRFEVGVDALKLSPEDGERVLTAIAQGNQSVIRFEARRLLENWKKGEFTVTWWDD